MNPNSFVRLGRNHYSKSYQFGIQASFAVMKSKGAAAMIKNERIFNQKSNDLNSFALVWCESIRPGEALVSLVVVADFRVIRLHAR